MFLIGLVASFFTIIYAYGRNTFSLSRAGYFPKFLSETHGSRKTPHIALVAGAVVGYAVFFLVWYLQQQELGAQIVAALLNMAVFAAVISYILQMVSFVVLRQRLPNIARPYRSPWGVPGAVIAGALAATALVAIFLNEDYRPGVYGVAIYYVLGVLYFAIAGRNRLVLVPRGGVRPHRRRARRSAGELRDERRGTGGDPAWWERDDVGVHRDADAIAAAPAERQRLVHERVRASRGAAAAERPPRPPSRPRRHDVRSRA